MACYIVTLDHTVHRAWGGMSRSATGWAPWLRRQAPRCTTWVPSWQWGSNDISGLGSALLSKRFQETSFIFRGEQTKFRSPKINNEFQRRSSWRQPTQPCLLKSINKDNLLPMKMEPIIKGRPLKRPVLAYKAHFRPNHNFSSSAPLSIGLSACILRLK